MQNIALVIYKFFLDHWKMFKKCLQVELLAYESVP